MRYEEIIEFDTTLTADVVDWCPNAESNILACGTYQLVKDTATRKGSLHLFNLNESHKELDILCKASYDSSGILDLKWINSTHIISIDSNNTLNLLNFDINNQKLDTVDELLLDSEESPIGLTLDYSNESNGTTKVLTSDTLGHLYLSTIDDSKIILNSRFKAHDYEIWSVLLDKNEKDILYSGADDCVLKMWDLRKSTDNPVSKCSSFDGGICSIIHPQRKDLSCLEGYSTYNILCGSYDERIHVLDKRNMKREVNQSNKLDGGVWKMKLNEFNDLLLCACMHTGVHIVNTSNLKSELYYEHHGLNNLAYGCDWSNIRSQTENGLSQIVATCSFYNHNLRLWKVIKD